MKYLCKWESCRLLEIVLTSFGLIKSHILKKSNTSSTIFASHNYFQKYLQIGIVLLLKGLKPRFYDLRVIVLVPLNADLTWLQLKAKTDNVD